MESDVKVHYRKTGFRLPDAWTQVTRFSKLLALIMFLGFPIIGFWLGTEFQKVPARPVFVPKIILKPVYVKDNEDLSLRCGDFPDKVMTSFDLGNNMYWSHDCRYIAWDRRSKGVARAENNGSNTDAGLFVYNDRTQKIQQMYKPVDAEYVRLQTWKGSQTLIFSKDDSTNLYEADVKTGIIRESVAGDGQ